jgi:hypothetical protein
MSFSATVFRWAKGAKEEFPVVQVFIFLKHLAVGMRKTGESDMRATRLGLYGSRISGSLI